VIGSFRTIDDNSVKDDLLNKQPLLRRATERHSGFKQSREHRRPHGSLPILRRAEVLIGKTMGVIKSVIERFGNSPEIAPAQKLIPNPRETDSFLIPKSARL
jgi:hypothetical protein